MIRPTTIYLVKFVGRGWSTVQMHFTSLPTLHNLDQALCQEINRLEAERDELDEEDDHELDKAGRQITWHQRCLELVRASVSNPLPTGEIYENGIEHCVTVAGTDVGSIHLKPIPAFTPND